MQCRCHGRAPIAIGPWCSLKAPPQSEAMHPVTLIIHRMVLVLAVMVALAASPSTGFAQTREPGSMDKAATSHIAEIAEYLKMPRSAGRDGHLYSVAVLLFEAIDFGKVKMSTARGP